MRDDFVENIRLLDIRDGDIVTVLHSAVSALRKGCFRVAY